MRSRGTFFRLFCVLVLAGGAAWGLTFTPDANTVGLYHFDGNLDDAAGVAGAFTQVAPIHYETSLPGYGSALWTEPNNPQFYDYNLVNYDSWLRYQGTDGWTVEALVYVPSTTSDVQVAVQYSAGVSGHDPYSLGIRDNGTEAYWQVGWGGDPNKVEITGAFTPDAWHHIAGVYDGSTNQIRLYVDGSLASWATLGGTMEVYATDYVAVGSLDAFGIDELRFSNIARYPAPPVPEPASIILLGIGLAGLGVRHYRKRAS